MLFIYSYGGEQNEANLQYCRARIYISMDMVNLFASLIRALTLLWSRFWWVPSWAIPSWAIPTWAIPSWAIPSWAISQLSDSQLSDILLFSKKQRITEYDNTFKHVNTALYCIILIHDEMFMYVRELHYSGWNKGVWWSDGPGRHWLNNS